MNPMLNSDTAIRVEEISKIYRIGKKAELYDNFARSFFEFLKNPLTNYRTYRSLYHFGDHELEESQNDKNNSSDILWALKNVSFSAKKGETIGIIGKNGAGKSTLLKILCRITDPTRGRAMVRGRISSLLEVGTGFHPELTGRDNVFLNGTILGMRRSEVISKFDDIVAFSGVEKFIDTPVKRYSSGMKVRLAFSVAAHLEPELLIVDEVLAVGDADFQRKCLDKMENVGQEGRTVLFVSHNMAAISRLCQRAIWVDQGRIVVDGPAHQVVAAYMTSETGTSAIRKWPDAKNAPGGRYTRLRAVTVRTDNGEISDSIDIRRPFTVEISFDVIQSGALLLPHFSLRNGAGVTAFVAVDLDPEWRGKPRPKGHYISIAHVPGNLLAEGNHFLNCYIRTLNPDSNEAIVPNAVSFNIVDSSEGDSARGDYAKNMPGVVRPLLKWETQFSPAEQMSKVSAM
jgi:lipopolysaccharide transport system ATP-binding protein